MPQREGTINGSFNETFMFNGAAALETPEFVAARIDEFGTADGLQPLRRRLGARDGHALPVDEAGRLALGRHAQRTIVHWPTGFTASGEVRSQFHHVIDIAPTVLEAAGLPQPTIVNGVQQIRSRARACATPSTARRDADRRETQYFEMFCNRGIYHQGWTR